jgi:type II restriction/modification system DNA methylase subunit YeeA
MATGGNFGVEEIRKFDGGLFNNAEALTLDSDGMQILSQVCDLDWTSIEPSILGTLFARSLDPDERAKLGAQYTSKDDILAIVEPVLMAPLCRRWEEIKTQAGELATLRDSARGKQTKEKFNRQVLDLLTAFATELANIKVLDPASGSGNFLYVSLKELLDLWQEVSTFGSEIGLALMMPDVTPSPSPAEMHGIEINTYAHELANTSVWIGYIQWRRDNGFGFPPDPVLKRIEVIQQMDAILGYDKKERPKEPEWPQVDVIVGNPPFLGGKRIRTELGHAYVEKLFALYNERVPREADLVCYWFEKARAMIESGKAKRAGLLATQAIRGGANRRVLERIKETGDIFMAWGDRPWILDGAAVRVSMIGFDNGNEQFRALDGKPVKTVNPDLTTSHDLTTAQPLEENKGIAFMGDTKAGAFDIDDKTARMILSAKGNLNSRPNRDVVKPWVNGLDVTRRPRNMWIIDFGTEMPMEQAAKYEQPFEHVKKKVKPIRAHVRRQSYVEKWWIHGEARHSMRTALATLNRYIATPEVAKHRLFTWFGKEVLPDHQLLVFARDDDYFFGVLHSKPHELWALRMGTALTDRPRYTPTTTFETYAFPWAPSKEPKDDPRVQRIAEAARELVEKRDAWLNPPDLSESELKKRTLTNLYNERPPWLNAAHRKLDKAVFDAYGWPHDLSDDEILERLLKLNLQRSSRDKR